MPLRTQHSLFLLPVLEKCHKRCKQCTLGWFQSALNANCSFCAQKKPRSRESVTEKHFNRLCMFTALAVVSDIQLLC